MEIFVRTRTRLREIDQECQARLARLEAVVREAEQIRLELSQAEQEIAEVWCSDLPRTNKLLLVQVLKAQCQQLARTLHHLQAEAAATAPPPRLAYRRRRE